MIFMEGIYLIHFKVRRKNLKFLKLFLMYLRNYTIVSYKWYKTSYLPKAVYDIMILVLWVTQIRRIEKEDTHEEN